MLQSFRERFADQTNTLASLTKSLQPTIDAGPDQQGMGPNELAAANTAIINTTGANYANAKAALQTTLDARGGGNVALPSGAEGQLQEVLASKAAGMQSAEQLQLTERNYALGREKYNAAVQGEFALAHAYDPMAFGSSAQSGFGSSFDEAHMINQENNQAEAEEIGAGVSLGMDALTFGAGALGGSGGKTGIAGGLNALTGVGG
jgi:hypothetical protein